MKYLLPVSMLVSIILGPLPVLAGTLTIPMSFEYLAVDGKPVQSSMFNHKAKLDLSTGEHKIAIRYHEMVPDDFSDSQSFIKSAPFIVTLNASTNGNYRLKPVGGDEVKYPQEFAKSPQIQILTNTGTKASYQVEYTNIKERSFFSRLLGDDTGVDISHASATATKSPPQFVPTAKPAINSQTPTQAQQMLHYWWQQADEQTRKEFMGWAIKQL